MYIDVSPGELFDKYSILVIKSENISDKDKLKNVEEELSYIGSIILRDLPISKEKSDKVVEYCKGLAKVNKKLWDVEDRLRIHEANQDFGTTFIELARSVYKLNDERAELKRNINIIMNSPYIEEKSYGNIGRIEDMRNKGGTE